MANSKRQAIIVLGMHRSGTSALAGALATLGMRPPLNLMPPTSDNPTGYFESNEIVAIHDRLLAAAGTSWSTIEGPSEDWFKSVEASAFVGELVAAVQGNFADAETFVVKDPRMCRLMPLWRRVLAEVGVKVGFVIPLRNPLEVARSLEKRDGIPSAHGCLLWLSHMLEAERETRGSPRVVINYSDLLSDPARIAAGITSQLIDEAPALTAGPRQKISSLIDPNLRHHIAQPKDLHRDEAFYPWLWDTYEAIAALVEHPNDGVALQGLDRVRAVFKPASASFAPLLAARAATWAEQESKLTALGRTLADRNQAIAVRDQAITERDRKIFGLHRALAERDRQIVNMSRSISEIYSSRSWKITKSLRWCGRQLRRAGMLLTVMRKAPSLKGGVLSLAISALRVYGREGVAGLKLRVVSLHKSAQLLTPQISGDDISLYELSAAAAPPFVPRISIIVPNYNHKRFLRKRLESIYGQTYRNFEVILLDDGSNDGSQEILREYANQFPEITKTYFNQINSGRIFSQWKKGLELATGDLVWIAESDDYCTANLLAELSKPFENPAVMVAFCRSDFVKGEPPARVWTTEEYWGDINFSRWENGFVKSAHWLVNNGWAVRNIIPNASSAIFRRPGDLNTIVSSGWATLELCGDWIFYLHIARGGLVAYRPNATNFYRQHISGTSTNVQRTDSYYREYEIVAKTLVSLYKINHGTLERQRDDLSKHWKATRGNEAYKGFRALYDLDRVLEFAGIRKPNLVMVVYALTPGGGETFPITLANLFKAQGYGVTLFNANQEKSEPGIKAMVNQSVPLLEIAQPELISAVLEDIGAEIVHTHHADTDLAFSTHLLNKPQISQVATIHGMYEMMRADDIKSRLPLLAKRIDCFVYAAEKNVSPFPKEFRDTKRFVRINNGLPLLEIKPVSRAEIGIEADAFVLCLVARAIPHKGWREAIQAVMWARNNSIRKIHLLLIGEGPEYDRLRAETNSTFIHFLGFRANIRDYFATSDMGFLPSRFKGESFPLVLVDCLLAGRPMLASNVGEIYGMLTTKDGLAGEIFNLDNWTIPIQTVGQLICDLANNKNRYQALLKRVADAAAKFNPAVMVKEYVQVYEGCLDNKKNSLNSETMNRKSILLVTHDCYPHGAQFLLLQIAKQLKLDGFSVTTITLGDGELLKEFSAVGRIIQVASASMHDLRNILRHLKAEGVNDAFTSTVVCGNMVPLLKEMGFRTLSLIHELPNVIRQMKQESNAVAIAHYADKVVFATEAICESFGEFATVAPEKILIRPQGVLRENPYKNRRAEAYQIICQKHHLPLHTKIVLSIGYVQPRKGPDLLVNAAANVLRTHPNTTFIWIGDADESTEKKVLNRITDLGLQGRVLFLGFDPYPMAYYAAASVYALTSREDPFPNVAIESIEVGVPVVAFKGATSAGEYIVETGGVLARAEDAADFAEKLCQLLDSPGSVKTSNSVGSLHQYVLDLLHSLNGFPGVSVSDRR